MAEIIPDKIIDEVDGREIWHASKVKAYLGIVTDSGISELYKKNIIEGSRYRWYFADTVKAYKEKRDFVYQKKKRIDVTMESLRIENGTDLVMCFPSDKILNNFIDRISSVLQINITGRSIGTATD